MDDGGAAGERGPHAGLDAPGAEAAGRRREDGGRVRTRHQHHLREVCGKVSRIALPFPSP